MIKYKKTLKGDETMYCKNCGTNVADGLAYCPNCGAGMDNIPSGNLAQGNLRMSAPQQNSAPQAQYGYAPAENVYSVPMYEQPMYSPEAERYTPPKPKKLSGAAIAWHVIAAILCFALLCTTIWTMIEPSDGIIIKALEFEADAESYYNSDVPSSDNPIFGFVATVGAGVGIFDATESPAALFLVIATIMGYLMLIAVLITLVIYLIMCMCGKNKTGVASFSSIAAFVVAVLLIASILMCNMQTNSSIRDSLGIFGRAYDAGLGELESRYGYGNLIEPTVALYSMLVTSILAKIALSVSKNLRDRDLKE